MPKRFITAEIMAQERGLDVSLVSMIWQHLGIAPTVSERQAMPVLDELMRRGMIHHRDPSIDRFKKYGTRVSMSFSLPLDVVMFLKEQDGSASAYVTGLIVEQMQKEAGNA